MRSILFGLACACAAAINFTECYEPLIRLANGACNLAEAKPTALWIADTLLQKLQLLWLKFLCVQLSDCDCAYACLHLHGSACVCVRVCVSLEDLKASWQLLISHQKARLGLFTWHTPLFSACLKLDGSEMGSFIVSGSLKMARQSSVAQHWNNLEELWFTFIYIKSQGYLITRQTRAAVWMKPDWKKQRFHQASDKCCGLYRGKKNKKKQWGMEANIEACKYRLRALPITMAYGCIRNAMERLARWGMLLGAQPKEDTEDTYTLRHTCRVVRHGNPQQYYRINYWLLAGGVMLHWVSREGGRSMLTAARPNIPNTQYIHGWSRSYHTCTDIPLVFFLCVFFCGL